MSNVLVGCENFSARGVSGAQHPNDANDANLHYGALRPWDAHIAKNFHTPNEYLTIPKRL